MVNTIGRDVGRLTRTTNYMNNAHNERQKTQNRQTKKGMHYWHMKPSFCNSSLKWGFCSWCGCGSNCSSSSMV